MRLTQDQIAIIKQTVRAVLGDDARVILFGSRVDDTKKGGDIDLLFETDQSVSNRVTIVGALYVALIRKLGDRKIDILLKDATTPPAPVIDIARQTGIQPLASGTFQSMLNKHCTAREPSQFHKAPLLRQVVELIAGAAPASI